jgi:hypothetical protein
VRINYFNPAPAGPIYKVISDSTEDVLEVQSGKKKND